MSEFLSKPIKISSVSRPFSETHLVGSDRLIAGRGNSSSTDAPIMSVLTDGRRLGEGIGFQTSYLSLLPAGTAVDIFWSGNNVNHNQTHEAVRSRLSEAAHGNNIVLLTGGEHLHHETTGTDRFADPQQMKKYGPPDAARDRIGLALLAHAEESGLPIVAICRGSQLVINKSSSHLAIPGDHGQTQHHVESSDEGVMLRHHGVRDIFPDDLRDSLGINLPVLGEVNSAHAQGYRVRDISDTAMKQLNANGWFPWLVADVSGVDPLDQMYEGWLRVQDGMISGVMAQFHPELQDDVHGDAVRRFIREMLLANLSI